MDMDEDEIMGGSWSPQVNKKLSDTPPVVTPNQRERRAFGVAAPPADAFALTCVSERWAQNEEHERAHSGGRRPYDDLPSQDRVRAEALRVLEKAGDDVSPYALRQTRSGGLTTGGKAGPYSFRRSASTGVDGKNRVEPYLDEEPGSLYRSSSGSLSSDRSRRRPPAALAGLDLKNASPARQDAKKWTIDESEDLALDDEEDLVEIVSTENRITGGRSTSTSGYRDDPKGGGYKDYPSLNNLPSPWSSRYSVDQYMTGGATTKEVLASLEREEQRIAKSARNMFMTTAPTSSPSSPNLFGSGFSFRKSPSPSRDTNLRTMWSDNDLLTSNGRSLEQTFPSSGGHGFEKARRRRRLCVVGSILAVCLAVIIGASIGAKNKGADYSIGNSDGKPTTFYVMADVPYSADEETKLTRDLEGLPGDATFVIHLGNIQDASVTLCPENAYDDASAVLKTSPAPVFALPGENDWNNCPDPTKAWDNWSNYFMQLDDVFKPRWTVLRQSGRPENFSFFHNGILFIGLHLVGGRVHDQDEWNARHATNVDWVIENMRRIFKPDDYRAVVLMGNARPSNQQRSFFNEVLPEIRSLGKPTVYIHANAETSSKFSEYKPYDDVDNLIAVQIENGGRSPPLRVTVDFGPEPFLLG